MGRSITTALALLPKHVRKSMYYSRYKTWNLFMITWHVWMNGWSIFSIFLTDLWYRASYMIILVGFHYSIFHYEMIISSAPQWQVKHWADLTSQKSHMFSGMHYGIYIVSISQGKEIQIKHFDLYQVHNNAQTIYMPTSCIWHSSVWKTCCVCWFALLVSAIVVWYLSSFMTHTHCSYV